MENTRDLFGREVFEKISGETAPLFHEPVAVPSPGRDPIDQRIASKFDAAATPSLFGQTGAPVTR